MNYDAVHRILAQPAVTPHISTQKAVQTTITSSRRWSSPLGLDRHYVPSEDVSLETTFAGSAHSFWCTYTCPLVVSMCRLSWTCRVVVLSDGVLSDDLKCKRDSGGQSEGMLIFRPTVDQVQTPSDISFKKTFCLMNIRPQDLLSHEPTLWFRRHQLFWFGRTIFLRPQTATQSLNKCR